VTAPRRICKGASYLLTRRCHDRRFLLKPTKLTTQIIGYLLARASRRSGVQVHAYCAMSNHLHVVVTDPRATLPTFLQDLDSLVARAVNALYGQWGHFWEAGGYVPTLLDTSEEILGRCAYTLANPVAAGLVRRGKKWPGLWSRPEQVGEAIVFERPGHFFSAGGLMQERESLRLAVPPGFESAACFRERLEVAVAAREAEAAGERGGFLGVARILKQRAVDRPATIERKRVLRPRFAAGSHVRRLELARQLKAFLAEHREALLTWRRARRDVVFPEGTYLMRVAHGAVCAGAG
jgi:REP element-mobilizing transposase RayT